jgi:hypothetical protein
VRATAARQTAARVVGLLALCLLALLSACDRKPTAADDACNPKHPEVWCLERPTAWYLLVVHDYAVYKGLRERISDDAEWMVLGVFGTNDECSDFYMKRTQRTADDYDRFWSCLPNTDPVLTRRRVNWQGFPRPEERAK